MTPPTPTQFDSPCARTRCARAFTLTEILIVIGIIVLMLGLAVPAFRMITGGRSIDSTQNIISALLGRARSEAIGLQRVRGLWFFIDPRSPDRVSAAYVGVDETDFPSTGTPTRTVYLDLVPDHEIFQLSPGVWCQLIDNYDANSITGFDDRYIGFNKQMQGGAPPSNISYGGVILFDERGLLISRTFGFLIRDSFNNPTAIGNLLYLNSDPTATASQKSVNVPATIRFVEPKAAVPSQQLATQFGLILFDRQEFFDRGSTDDDQQVSGTAGLELAEEQWLDDNATPLMINRYNGTLIKGE